MALQRDGRRLGALRERPVLSSAEDSPSGLWRSLGKRVGLTALAGSNPASSASTTHGSTCENTGPAKSRVGVRGRGRSYSQFKSQLAVAGRPLLNKASLRSALGSTILAALKSPR